MQRKQRILITTQLHYEKQQRTIIKPIVTTTNISKAFSRYVYLNKLFLLTVLAKSLNQTIEEFFGKEYFSASAKIDSMVDKYITVKSVSKFSVYLSNVNNDTVHIYLDDGGYDL